MEGPNGPAPIAGPFGPINYKSHNRSTRRQALSILTAGVGVGSGVLGITGKYLVLCQSKTHSVREGVHAVRSSEPFWVTGARVVGLKSGKLLG
jgi:hypothetical protein